ncbi:MAG: tetratricopeptide repeat protein [Sphingomonas sp.]|nr:MAG: tetratricopeptide repeat protein [Sphingomonas sp.]
MRKLKIKNERLTRGWFAIGSSPAFSSAPLPTPSFLIFNLEFLIPAMPAKGSSHTPSTNVSTKHHAMPTPANTPNVRKIGIGELSKAKNPATLVSMVAAHGNSISLSAWSAYAAGRNPFAPLAAVNATRDPIAARFAGETRALLLIARGDTAAGLAMVDAVRTNGAPIDLRLAAAQLLFAADRPAEARALLTGDDPVLAGLREGAPAKASLGFGVSRLLARVAADLAAQQGPVPLSIALASGALRAEPGNDRARLLLADALSRDRATDRALAVLDGVDAGSPFAAAAAAARITVLANAGRTADALALAQARAERTDATTGDWQRYADRLATAERPADAAPWYRRIIDSNGMASDWAAWLQYGGALDQAGDWPGAERALEKALALAPSEPLALNYLGYARAERGEDLPGATKLLERANALRPLDGSIVDSLGWAYHLSGDTRRALPLLERAAAGDPTNAEIGEHLGDAYWALGRRYEARYAWRAAVLTATTADAARITAKLADGLPSRR